MKLIPYDLATLKKIRDASVLPSYARQREAIRVLVKDNEAIIATHNHVNLNHAAKAHGNNSPLIGPDPNQIKTRCTWAGLRDNMTLPALLNVLCVPDGANKAMSAISEPGMTGIGSTRSKTGYAFGMSTEHELKRDILQEVRALIHAIEASGGYTAEPVPPAMMGGTPVSSAFPFAPSKTPFFETRSKEETTTMKTKTVGPDALMQALGKIGDNMDKLTAVAILMADDSGTDTVDALTELTSLTTGKVKDHLESTKAILSVVPAKEFDKMLTTIKDSFAEDPDVLDAYKASKGELSTEAIGTTSPATFAVPPKEVTTVVDAVLATAGLPPIEGLIIEANKVEDMRSENEQAQSAIAKLEEELDEARRKASASASLAPAVPAPALISAGSGEFPEGKIIMRKAKEVFGLASPLLNFEVPTWEWDDVHPLVPAKMDGYIFRDEDLMNVLLGILKNRRTYLHGDTGTGKTSLVEQTAAFLNWPFFRINFDSHMTRMDMVGRDVVSVEDGASKSHFVDGVIPANLALPVLACYDEMDAAQPDMAYVMQRVFEGDMFIVTEDGGRIVRPHPWHRVFATGNTTGQGDERGLYQAPRQQSLALLDRFTNWVKVEYLDAAQRRQLIMKAGPNLDNDTTNIIDQYVTEHLEAFKDRKIMQPITPRGFENLADMAQTMLAIYGKRRRRAALERALDSTMISRATERDQAVLRGIMQRVIK